MNTKTARAVCVEILIEMEQEGTYSHLALKEALKGFSRQDSAFITEIVYGTLKQRIKLDYILNQFSKTPVKKMKPFIRNLMRMSVYQLIALDKVPPSAVINEAVKMVKQRKMMPLAGFVNGVLRNIERNKDETLLKISELDPKMYLHIAYSMPKWLIDQWVAEKGLECTTKICESFAERGQVSIRINTLQTHKEALIKQLKQEGVEVLEGRLNPESLQIKQSGNLQDLPSFKAGLWSVQDESATLVGHVVNPKPGETILDLCAAPGGKSCHLAELMGDQGEIISTDLYPHKILLIQESAKRLHLKSIKAMVQDGTILNPEWIGKFDKVLLDAPCSGLGILRGKPDIKYGKTKEDIKAIYEIQRQMMACAVQYLKPNGILVYSTCTISGLENQGMYRYALDELNLLKEPFEDSLEEPLKEILKEGLKEGRSDLELLPYFAQTDGFYIAQFRKRG